MSYKLERVELYTLLEVLKTQDVRQVPTTNEAVVINPNWSKIPKYL